MLLRILQNRYCLYDYFGSCENIAWTSFTRIVWDEDGMTDRGRKFVVPPHLVLTCAKSPVVFYSMIFAGKKEGCEQVFCVAIKSFLI